MKTNFQQSRKTSYAKKSAIVAGGFLLVIGIFSYTGGSLYSVVSWIGRPFFVASHGAQDFMANIGGSFGEHDELVAENKRLEDELTRVTFQTLSTRILEEENRRLKAILDRTQEKELVLGVVLAAPPTTFYDTLIIDIGKNAGVEAGDHVYAYGDVYLGEISDMTKNTSRVSLASAPEHETEVLIGTDTVRTRMRGVGGGNFMAQIPKDITVAVDDTVYLPSLTSDVVGVVEYIKSTEAEVFQEIYIRGPVNIWELEWVQVDTSTIPVETQNVQ